MKAEYIKIVEQLETRICFLDDNEKKQIFELLLNDQKEKIQFLPFFKGFVSEVNHLLYA